MLTQPSITRKLKEQYSHSLWLSIAIIPVLMELMVLYKTKMRLLLCFFLVTFACGDAELDVQSLLAFKRGVSHDPFHVLKNWHPGSSNPCNWTGVTCSTRHPHRVTELKLSDKVFGGSIAPEIGNLSFLHHLDLSINNFTGGLSAFIGRLHKLQWINVNDNSDLGGVIPSEFGSLYSFTEFDATRTGLTGTIPPSLGNCTRLQGLFLDENNLQEFGTNGEVSVKGDVYSFGIILLEVITGVKPTDPMFSGDMSLCNWVSMALKTEKCGMQSNPILKLSKGLECLEEGYKSMVDKILRVGVACCSKLPKDRPAMHEVEGFLTSLFDADNEERLRIGPGCLEAVLVSSLQPVQKTLESESSSTFG